MKTTINTRRLIFITLLLLFPMQECFPQSKSKRKKVFVANIKMKNSIARGMLYRVDDTSIEIIRRINKPSDTVFQTISIHDIKTITVRRKGLIATSIVAGIFIGALVGFASYQDPCDSESTFCFDFGPAYPAGIGAAIGGVFGVVTGLALVNTFHLQSKESKVDDMIASLRKYALWR